MTQAVDQVAVRTRPLLLAGEPVEGAEQVPVLFPFDGTEIGRVWLAGDEQVETALRSAAAAERETAALPPFRRAEILIAAAELVVRRETELAEQMTRETGNAVWETRLEVGRTAEILRLAGEEARRVSMGARACGTRSGR